MIEANWVHLGEVKSVPFALLYMRLEISPKYLRISKSNDRTRMAPDVGPKLSRCIMGYAQNFGLN